MAEIINMPKLGFDMAEGTLVRWVVSEGEQVERGQILAEIETDKATVEVEASQSGVILRHLVPEGEPVPVGDPIAVVGEEGEDFDVDALLSEQGVEAAPAEAVKPAEEEAPEAEETEATDEPVTAEPTAREREDVVEEPEPAGDDGIPGGVRASPLARRIAEEKGADLRKINGSGPQGRIVKKDVEEFLEKQAAAPAPERPAPKPERPAPEEEARPEIPLPALTPVGPPPEDKRIPVTRLRSAIGRRMLESKTQAPHFYVTHSYDMQPLMDIRKQVNQMLPDEQKISVNDFIVKAVALTLRRFPNLNAALDGNEVIQYGQINIGVAVAVEGGLLTVVVRDADRKPVRQISAELKEMVPRAREGKIRPDDVEGSTFSISNMGMFDVDHFIAIINPPEAAILAVGSAQEQAVVENGEIKPGLRMKATISIDHRVSDGAEGARFMQALEDYIEEPMRLLL